MTVRVVIVTFDDCLASAVTGSIDLLYAANAIRAHVSPGAPPAFSYELVSEHGGHARASNGLLLPEARPMARSRPAQIVVVPGLSLIEPTEFLPALARLSRTVRWLRAQHELGAVIGATCSGTFLLADAGLLDGRAATTTTWFGELFERRYPKVRHRPRVPLVEDDRVVTTGGAMSYIDLALHFIQRHAGAELAQWCARFVVMDNQRRDQLPVVMPHYAAHADPVIARAEKWIRANLKRDIRVEDVAANVAVSARTLMRRFKSAQGCAPLAFMQRVRIETAKGLLANTRFTVDQIAERVGYRDDGAFRRLFKKYTALSPREYRRRFGSTSG